MPNPSTNYYIEVVYFNKKIGYATYEDCKWKITNEFFHAEFFEGNYSAALQAVSFIGRFTDYSFAKGYGYRIKKLEVNHSLIESFDENKQPEEF